MTTTIEFLMPNRPLTTVLQIPLLGRCHHHRTALASINPHHDLPLWNLEGWPNLVHLAKGLKFVVVHMEVQIQGTRREVGRWILYIHCTKTTRCTWTTWVPYHHVVLWFDQRQGCGCCLMVHPRHLLHLHWFRAHFLVSTTFALPLPRLQTILSDYCTGSVFHGRR